MNNLIFRQEVRILQVEQKTAKNGNTYFVVVAVNQHSNILKFMVMGDLCIEFSKVNELTRIIADFRASVQNNYLNLNLQDFSISDTQADPIHE